MTKIFFRLIILFFLLLPQILFSATLIDDFEKATSPSPWVFYNGGEFPGATGSLTLGEGANGSKQGAHLAFDFSKGGNYVGANLSLPTPIHNAKILSFQARVPFGIKVIIRLVDTTGQTLQFEAARPLLAFSLSNWYRQELFIQSKPKNYWGGSNDGILHGGIKAISINAEIAKFNSTDYLNLISALDFDQL